jgi:hypothetical protein
LPESRYDGGERPLYSTTVIARHRRRPPTSRTSPLSPIEVKFPAPRDVQYSRALSTIPSGLVFHILYRVSPARHSHGSVSSQSKRFTGGQRITPTPTALIRRRAEADIPPKRSRVQFRGLAFARGLLLGPIWATTGPRGHRSENTGSVIWPVRLLASSWLIRLYDVRQALVTPFPT